MVLPRRSRTRVKAIGLRRVVPNVAVCSRRPRKRLPPHRNQPKKVGVATRKEHACEERFFFSDALPLLSAGVGGFVWFVCVFYKLGIFLTYLALFYLTGFYLILPNFVFFPIFIVYNLHFLMGPIFYLPVFLCWHYLAEFFIDGFHLALLHYVSHFDWHC